jgi:hypothetical protein
VEDLRGKRPQPRPCQALLARPFLPFPYLLLIGV